MESNQAEEAKLSLTELYYEALTAYIKGNKVCDEWPALPLRRDSIVNRNFVNLRSDRFLLAKYDVRKKELVSLK